MKQNIFIMNLLYDFYGSLLTDKQREIFEMHYLNDYSLGEISQILNISRQGVYDTLKRAEISLQFFEDKLSLVKKHKQLTEKIEEIKKLLDNIRLSTEDDRILKITDEIFAKLLELNP